MKKAKGVGLTAWFNDKKRSFKLLWGFLATGIITALVGMYGVATAMWCGNESYAANRQCDR